MARPLCLVSEPSALLLTVVHFSFVAVNYWLCKKRQSFPLWQVPLAELQAEGKNVAQIPLEYYIKLVTLQREFLKKV